jgi:nitrite reductase (NADH) small subunit
MSELHVVGPVQELRPGDRRIVTIGRRSIGVFNIGGEFYALSNMCPHAGGPLCLGDITGTTRARERHYDVDWIRDGEIIRCPWHAWEVDIKTGRTLAGPETRVRTYKVRVEDGQIVLEL